MRTHILNFPQQLSKGLDLAKSAQIQGQFDNVVFSAMGGSALAAEILANWLDLPIPFFINRNYHLPPYANQNTLVICCSYSGNTEECISAYQEARQKNLTTAVITAGGQLKKLSSQDNVPCVIIPPGLPQRMAVGYMFSVLYTILSNSSLVEGREADIRQAAQNLKPAQQEKEGESLAQQLAGKTPLIYSSYKLRSLSYVWKIKFNENAKIPSFAHCFPELNHNEMEGFNKKTFGKIRQSLHIIILQDPDDEPAIQKRMKLTAQWLENSGVSVTTIQLAGQTLLERMFSSILLADWVTYYLSLTYGVDALAVDAIEDFKKKMKE